MNNKKYSAEIIKGKFRGEKGWITTTTPDNSGRIVFYAEDNFSEYLVPITYIKIKE